jgi:hypothetical protein
MHKGLAKETTQEGGPGLKWGWAIYDIIFEYICADEMNEHHLQIWFEKQRARDLSPTVCSCPIHTAVNPSINLPLGDVLYHESGDFCDSFSWL